MAGRQNILELIKNLLFPKFCAGCGQEGSWLCEKCLHEVVARPHPTLPLKGEEIDNTPPFKEGKRGGLGKERQGEVSFLDGVTALFDYGENTISKLIQMFKYNYLLEITDIFEKIINATKFDYNWPDSATASTGKQDFVVMPVPLHRRRERERGFNQAEVLAKIFSKKFGLAVNKNLQRGIYTTQQAKLSRAQRLVNLKDAFFWTDGAKKAPEKVLLVDDVFTTGATMQECAKVLKNNGAKIVWGLVLARD